MERKVVLVTGASRGIGAAIAKKFGEEGYCVAINYCNSQKEAASVANFIERAGGKAAIFKCNVSDYDAAKKMVGDVVRAFGKIDVLVNNAGIVIRKPLNEKTADDWNKTLSVNLIAPFMLAVEAAKYMEHNGSGTIINISSTSAKFFDSNVCDYDASKAALNTLTQNLAQFYMPKIRVNSVLPGWVKTDMTIADGINEDEMNSNFLGRAALPGDVADVVFFLASDAARHVNGAEIVVNGGGIN